MTRSIFLVNWLLLAEVVAGSGAGAGAGEERPTLNDKRQASRKIEVQEEEPNRCGRCIRGCLSFLAGMREVRQPDTGGNPVLAGVEAVVDVVALASERALQQFVYHDMRRAVQRAEQRLQELHRASAQELWRRIMYGMSLTTSLTMEEVVQGVDEEVWTELKKTVVRHELIMREHQEHYAERTDGIVEVAVLNEVMESLREFVENDADRDWLKWDAVYKDAKLKLDRTARVLQIAIEVDDRGQCIFWLCRSCGVRSG